MGVIKEFREFAVKGNVIDLAVGIIIGSAFGKIVSSLVNDILMPPLGLLLGGVNFKDMKVILREAVLDATGKVTVQAISLNFGMFIQTMLDFLLVAVAVFLIIRTINMTRKKKAEEPAPLPVPTVEETLLMEIRDLLKR